MYHRPVEREEILFIRDILIKCLTVTNLRTEARTELEGTLAIGVRMDATDIRLDYRWRNCAPWGQSKIQLTLSLIFTGIDQSEDKCKSSLMNCRTGDEAELHLRLGLLIEGVLVGLDSEATIEGCLVPR